jgi:hypothetical protein
MGNVCPGMERSDMRLFEISFNSLLHSDDYERVEELVPETALAEWLENNPQYDEIDITCLGSISDDYISREYQNV